MVSFGSTATGATTLLAVILSTSDAAAYVSHRTPRRHYSTALGARSRVPLFSRDVERVFRDFDYMFDSMMGDVESNFYSPLSLRRMTTPRLQQVPTKRQLSAPRATYQTSQDESEVRIAFNVPGAQASDIDLQLDEDKRILRITGETKLEEGDLHLSRKFDQTFTLARDVDMTKATAQFKDNVLTVTAPKVESKVRNLAIDVVESPPAIEQAADSGTTQETQENQEAAQNENANEKSLTVAVETDEPSSESVIDLDAAKE
mmetsp:Transcript_3515/g.7852  ORF Transcript_3515/g.7852 Transcript_3515/m.7852 type:complete len:260 (+) Transcript_3515:252-1031(+)